MTTEEALKDELLVSLCCGERCMAAINGDGVCERWTYKSQVDALSASADEQLAKIAAKQRKAR